MVEVKNTLAETNGWSKNCWKNLWERIAKNKSKKKKKKTELKKQLKEKVINYISNGKTMIISLYKISCFLEPHNRSTDKIKVELYLSNHTTKFV